MNPTARRQPHIWAAYLLIYLVCGGLFPFFSEIRTFASVHGVNPNDNNELAWGLMHIVPALGGVAIALWYLRHNSLVASAAVLFLMLQILFALLEYRREGFDQRLTTGIGWTHYLTAMGALAVPFLAIYFISARKARAAI